MVVILDDVDGYHVLNVCTLLKRGNKGFYCRFKRFTALNSLTITNITIRSQISGHGQN